MATTSNPQVLSLLKDLVNIKSTTGQEKECALFLKQFLESHGMIVELQPLANAPERLNVFAYFGPEGKTPKILFNSHIDTVPPHIPLTEDQENFYGRGTCDAKGPIAAQITAVLSLRAQGRIKDGEVSLLYVVGEEVDHCGMIEANKLGIKTNYLIVGEPTESRLAKGHKGIIRFSISCKGVAGHSGYPEKGKSAIAALVDILFTLHNTKWPVDAYLGPTTFNTGVIEGGVAANVIPENAYADITIRVSTSANQVLEMVEKVLTAPRSDGMKVTYEIKEPSEPVQCDIQVAESVGVETFVAAYFTDIPFLKGDHKALLIGPGSITVAHADNEFVNKKELQNHVEIYSSIIKQLL